MNITFVVVGISLVVLSCEPRTSKRSDRGNLSDAKAYKKRGNAKCDSLDFRGAVDDYTTAIEI
ncbi:MAG: hypothetical protein ABJA70_20830, partial [Chryseolinea sp.]